MSKKTVRQSSTKSDLSRTILHQKNKDIYVLQKNMSLDERCAKSKSTSTVLYVNKNELFFRTQKQPSNAHFSANKDSEGIPISFRRNTDPKMTPFFEPKKALLWQGLHTSNYNGSSSRKRNSNFFLSSSLIPCSSIHLPKA